MKTFKFKWLLLSVILSLASSPQMWAWQAHGTFNSWGNASMSNSSANSAVYYYAVSGTNVEFKVTGDSGWGDHEMGNSYINNDYGNVSLTNSSGNIKGGVTGTWYICYHSGDDKVYATTTNPNYPDMVIAGNNFGSIGSWSTTSTVMSSNGSGTYTKTIDDVAVGDCQFKIIYKGTWTGAIGYDSKKVSGTNCSSGPSDASGNISFTPGAAGSVTITYDQSTGNITITCPKYSVTYDGNGKTSGSVPTDGSSPYNSGSTVTVLANTGSLAKTGCVFDGWMTAQDGSGTTYAPGATFSISAPTTLYARWIAKTIYVYDGLSWGGMKLYTFDDATNGSWPGTGGVTSLGSSWYQVDILSGSGTFILNNNNGSSGPQTADLTTSSYTSGRSYEIYDNSGTKYIREKKLSVSFNMKSHGSSVDAQNVYYNGLVTEPSPAPSATGYTFGGWYKESACTNAWNFSTDKVTAATTLYAKWTAIQYNGTIDKNGGGADKSYSATYDATTLTIAAAPTRTGYNLSGYYEESACTHLIANTSKTLQANTTYTNSSSKWNYTSAPKLYAGWTAKTYTATNNIKDEDGTTSKGTYTATYDATSIAINTTPTKSGYHVEGYYISTIFTSANKVADATGALEASVSSFTDASRHWIKDANVNLYVHWEEDAANYTLTFGVANSPANDGTLAVTAGGAAASSGSSYVASTSIACTATPGTHSRVKGWYSDNSCISAIGGAGTGNTYNFSLSANTSVYVGFETATTTITLEKNGGSTGAASVTATHGSALSSFTAHSRSGYTLNGYYTASSGGTKIINADGTLVASTSYTDGSSKWNVKDRTLTLHAQWTENKVTLTPTVSYDHGTSSYTASADNQIGVTTSSRIKCSKPNTDHYTFAGWTLTNLTVTSGASATDTIIYVKVTTPGSAVSAVAKYEEVLTTSYELRGGSAFGTHPTNPWNNVHEFRKKSGHSTESVAYYTASIASTNTGDANTDFQFKIKNGDTWYGITDDGSQWYYTREVSEGLSKTQTMSSSGKNIELRADVAGDYEIKVDFSSTPTITITFPTSYTLTYALGALEGTDGSISSSPTTSSGSKVLSGSTVTLTAPAAKAGYSWKGWYTDEDGTTGKIDDTNRAISVTMNADKELYACYTENDYTVTVSATAGGSITTPASPATSVTAHPETTAAIVAEEAYGYYFVNWTTEDAGITIANANNKSTTITATTAGTVTANFAELEKIFFRNENETTGEKLWDVDKMYVYFNVDWADAGDYSGVSTTSGNFAEMNPVSAGSNIFWAYIPRAITTANYTKIAFSDVWMGENEYPDDLYDKFWENNGVYRTDYIMYLNMFVPACKSSNTSNSTTYYSNGYWMKYNTQTDQGASYYLKESTGSGELSEFKVAAPNGNAIYTTYRFENTTAKRFYIANAKGTFYKANSNITSIAYADVEMGEGNGGFLVTPTAEGDYTFTIDQSGDTMKITVKYPISAGDYRLDYTHETSKHLYTDIIKPSTTSSVTTIKKSVYIDPSKTAGVYNNSLKLQKCSGLDGSANPIWTSGVSISLDNFTSGKGVYEFDIEIDNTGKTAAQEVKSVALDNVKLYEGTYYIKTDYAPGGWVNYKRNILTENTINFDKEDSKTFDYYHCAWVGDGGMNVKCIIANEYNQQVTDTLIGDDVLGLDGGKPRQYLETAANVRFSYNSYTNELKRAYINGSSDHHDYYLYLEGTKVDADLSTDGTQSSNSLTDRNNWTYMLNIQAQPGARVRLTAKYGDEEDGVVQSFIGDKTGDLSTSNTVEIMGGDGDDWSNLRVVYDFKTNNLMTAWLIPGGTIESDQTINADVMIIRKDQGDAEQITFGGSAKKLDEVGVVYSTMQFTYNHLANKKVNGSDSTLVSSEREFYWVSFPHDVLLSDIFGSVGSFYNEWGILYYDGKERAKNGNWADTEGFWKYFTNPNDTLKAFEGYVLVIDLPLVGTVAEAGKWINGVRDLYLYFPSLKEIGNIHKGDTTINIDQTGYKCEIDRRTDKSTPNIDKDRRIADSYWHLIGAPSFKNASHASGNDWDEGKPNISDWSSTSVPFVYEWNKKTDEYTPVTTSSFTFKAMHSYMVQYSGTTITWNSISAPKPVSVARRSPQEETGAYEWRLSLLNGEEEQDRTFIRMTNEEDVTAGFEFNYDLCKEINKNAANIYTFADYVPVAGNVLPMSGQTTVIPVGVKIATNGDYTFSIPEGTEGVGVTLIDKEAGIRTNLSALDYTVSLEAGKNDNRFVLEVSPIHNMPTEIEQTGISNQQSAVKKVLIDGLLYIVRDGKMYDARGARVE